MTSQLRAVNASAVNTALQRFRSSSADFADCLLGTTNAVEGCEYTATFDRKASKLPEFRQPSAGYFLSVTQIRSMGFFPTFPDSCPSLKSIVGIQPTSPSGEASG